MLCWTLVELDQYVKLVCTVSLRYSQLVNYHAGHIEMYKMTAAETTSFPLYLLSLSVEF